METRNNSVVELVGLNNRQLQLIAAVCLHRFCKHFEIASASIDMLISHLAALSTTSDLVSWDEQGQNLPLTGRGDPLPPDLASLNGSILSDFREIMDCAVEVGIVDLYGAATSKPLNFVKRCIDLVESRGVQLPPFDKIASSGLGSMPWGEPIKRADLAEILEFYGFTY